jgi:hypothetical protein
VSVVDEVDASSPRLRIWWNDSVLCIRVKQLPGVGEALVQVVMASSVVMANLFFFGVLIPQELPEQLLSWRALILIAFAAVFGSMGCYMVGCLVFGVLGSQEFFAGKNEWKLTTRALGVGVRRSFEVPLIRGLRVDAKIYPRKKGTGRAVVRRIAFNYKKQAVRTLGNLSEAEANQILQLLNAQLPPQ